jgi:osomolarity two-component system response regulator SSK1
MSGITKVWVRRPNCSPTRISIPSSPSTLNFSPLTGESSGARDNPRQVDVELTEDFLVDDLRDCILRKYPQSLGKHHDSADLAIQIPKGGGEAEDDGRLLAPDESVLKVLTEEYPNGQRSADAWTVVTTGGRHNYTRWWLQTGGMSTDYPVRGAFSPSQYIPSTVGSFGSDIYHQEYFPYVPQTVATPPGEFLPRSRQSESSMIPASQYPRSQGRPALRPGRSVPEGMFPPRRFDNTQTSSMIVEGSAPESEQGRDSPDLNALPHMRYPRNLPSNNSNQGRNTPPSEYPNRARQYTTGNKQPPMSAGQQSFQMQLPSQSVPTIPQVVQPPSPLGGPPQQRLSTSRPVINSSPNIPPEKPPHQGSNSPKSPMSGNSSHSGGSTHSPATRRKSNTISGQQPVISESTSPVVEHSESPRTRTTNVPLVQVKEKDPVAPNKTSAIGVIPPINVLIVEDNIINAQILEVFFRKRKLKYATAVNGKEAVEKWRQGGWHLVLVYNL